jgi:hypothetical protein
MKKAIAELTTYCGAKCDVSIPLSNMKPHIEQFANEALSIISKRKKHHYKTLAPFIGRGLLEASFTALLFRIDPFRATTLSNFHSHADFDHNRPQQISIDWSTDIVSDVDVSKDIWLPKQKAEAVSRALLSPYQDRVLWQPALAEARDFAATQIASLGIPSLVSQDAENFISRIRGEARQLYSFWSKGIHCEFFSIGPHTLDDVTCSEKLLRTTDIVLDLAFVSQFTPISIGNCSPSKALKLYGSAKESLYA